MYRNPIRLPDLCIRVPRDRRMGLCWPSILTTVAWYLRCSAGGGSSPSQWSFLQRLYSLLLKQTHFNKRLIYYRVLTLTSSVELNSNHNVGSTCMTLKSTLTTVSFAVITTRWMVFVSAIIWACAACNVFVYSTKGVWAQGTRIVVTRITNCKRVSLSTLLCIVVTMGCTNIMCNVVYFGCNCLYFMCCIVFCTCTGF